MLKGALTSVILMFVFIPIPVVHFFAVPLSPFIGGFIGGSIAKAEKEKIILFSFITTGITAIPSFFIIIYSFIRRSNNLEVAGMDPFLAIILAIILIPYTSCLVYQSTLAYKLFPVSYTHLTLPTNREV